MIKDILRGLQIFPLTPILHAKRRNIMTSEYKCIYCGKDDLFSQRALTLHIAKDANCNKLQRSSILGDDKSDDDDVEDSFGTGSFRSAKRTKVSSRPTRRKLRSVACETSLETPNLGVDPNDFDIPVPDDDLSDADPEDPDLSILAEFAEYVEKGMKIYDSGFSLMEAKAIRLMAILRAGDASLMTYESVMEWHFRENSMMRSHQSITSHKDFISRKRIFKKLLDRYNLKEKFNIPRVITLPSSKTKVKIITNDFRACLQSLLSDPRIVDDDYLFFNNDPRSPPPKQPPHYIEDINTGLAYIKSYAKYVKYPGRQVLLPVIFYIDGAATGQFAHLPVTALKFTLGIFNRKAREKTYLWRTLGYVPVVTSETSKGRRKLIESGHVDAQITHQDMMEDEGIDDSKNVVVAQDMHTILETILAGYVEIQGSGFVWDLMYRNKKYANLEFIPFVPFIKSDTEEADRLCGKYLSRGKGVSQLCRYCCCPAQESDNPNADYYPRKTQKMIGELVNKRDVDGLKQLSQQLINNCFYQIRFGAHSEEGIHGACPLEMLHALLLGIFKYTRDCFFAKIGANTQVSDDINALAAEYGALFSRQSDRNMPKTNFGSGITVGKMMAKEFRGVLLNIAVILNSTEGKSLLLKRKNGGFPDKDAINDWIMLVETLLMWEAWLKSDRLPRNLVERAKNKHKYIMYLIRKVGDRTKGMGLKILKYHAIVHMADDILNFGVPMNFDTGSDESGHKPAKRAARRTQRVKETFDEQVNTRLVEVHCIDMAIEEMDNNRCIWHYYGPKHCAEDVTEKAAVRQDPVLGGSILKINDQGDGTYSLTLTRKTMGSDAMTHEPDYSNFLGGLAKEVGKYTEEPVVRTTYTDRDGTIYRGSSLFKGRVWRDWVTVDWGGSDGQLPNKIWGFVDLRHLPKRNQIEYGGLFPIPPAIYAIVENAKVDEKKKRTMKSDLFTPVAKEVRRDSRKNVVGQQFYLSNVLDFLEPLVIIPDIGGRENDYLMMRSRVHWEHDFAKWLERKHEKYEAFDDDESQEDYDEDWDDDIDE